MVYFAIIMCNMVAISIFVYQMATVLFIDANQMSIILSIQQVQPEQLARAINQVATILINVL